MNLENDQKNTAEIKHFKPAISSKSPVLQEIEIVLENCDKFTIIPQNIKKLMFYESGNIYMDDNLFNIIEKDKDNDYIPYEFMMILDKTANVPIILEYTDIETTVFNLLRINNITCYKLKFIDGQTKTIYINWYEDETNEYADSTTNEYQSSITTKDEIIVAVCSYK